MANFSLVVNPVSERRKQGKQKLVLLKAEANKKAGFIALEICPVVGLEGNMQQELENCIDRVKIFAYPSATFFIRRHLPTLCWALILTHLSGLVLSPYKCFRFHLFLG